MFEGSDSKNTFTDVTLAAALKSGAEPIKAPGFFDGAVYCIPGYSSAAIADRVARKLTVAQFDGDDKKISKKMAKAPDEIRLQLEQTI